MIPNSLNKIKELTNETGKKLLQLIEIKEFYDKILSYNETGDKIQIKFAFCGYTIEIIYLKHVSDYIVLCNSSEYTKYLTTIREFLNYIKKELRKNKIKNIRNEK